jgi:hypothetical protein
MATAHSYLIVDNKTLSTSSFNSNNDGTNICGNDGLDKSLLIDVNSTHSSSNMLINITNDIKDNIFFGTYGIKDLFILIDYVKFKK